jgi:hypothetical protein
LHRNRRIAHDTVSGTLRGFRCLPALELLRAFIRSLFTLHGKDLLLLIEARCIPLLHPCLLLLEHRHLLLLLLAKALRITGFTHLGHAHLSRILRVLLLHAGELPDRARITAACLPF